MSSKDGEPTKLEHLQAGSSALGSLSIKDRGAGGAKLSDFFAASLKLCLRAYPEAAPKT